MSKRRWGLLLCLVGICVIGLIAWASAPTDVSVIVSGPAALVCDTNHTFNAVGSYDLDEETTTEQEDEEATVKEEYVWSSSFGTVVGGGGGRGQLRYLTLRQQQRRGHLCRVGYLHGEGRVRRRDL